MMDVILTENDSTILDVVYSTYAPSSYKRTGEFQEAWDTRVGTAYKTAEGEFYFKPEIMTVDYDYFNPETMDADYNSGPPRLYGSGMLIINFPWKLDEKTKANLDYITKHIYKNEKTSFSIMTY